MGVPEAGVVAERVVVAVARAEESDHPERGEVCDRVRQEIEQDGRLPHLVRRDDVCWGTSFKDIQKGNGDTYHTTNCSPQTAGFNQSSKGEDNWGDLENMVQREAGAERVIIFSGPVFAESDLRFEGVDKRGDVLIQIPRSYWKIIIAAGDKGPEAYGFILKQDLRKVPLEFSVPKQWHRYVRRIKDIEKLMSGWVSFDAIKEYDQYSSVVKRRSAGRRS